MKPTLRAFKEQVQGPTASMLDQDDSSMQEKEKAYFTQDYKGTEYSYSEDEYRGLLWTEEIQDSKPKVLKTKKVHWGSEKVSTILTTGKRPRSSCQADEIQDNEPKVLKTEMVDWVQDTELPSRSNFLDPSGFFINPHMSRSDAERIIRYHVDRLIQLPDFDDEPEVVACPLLAEVISPVVLGLQGYDSEYLLKMRCFIVDGVLDTGLLLNFTTDFIESQKLDTERSSAIRSLVVKNYVPFFSAYREYLQEDIMKAYKEVEAFCESVISIAQWPQNKILLQGQVKDHKEYLVMLKMYEYEALQPPTVSSWFEAHKRFLVMSKMEENEGLQPVAHKKDDTAHSQKAAGEDKDSVLLERPEDDSAQSRKAAGENKKDVVPEEAAEWEKEVEREERAAPEKGEREELLDAAGQVKIKVKGGDVPPSDDRVASEVLMPPSVDSKVLMQGDVPPSVDDTVSLLNADNDIILRNALMTERLIGQVKFLPAFVDMLLNASSPMTTDCFDALFQFEVKRRGGLPQKVFCIDPLVLHLPNKRGDDMWKHVDCEDFTYVYVPMLHNFHWSLVVLKPLAKPSSCLIYLLDLEEQSKSKREALKCLVLHHVKFTKVEWRFP
ncbi:hypothetical protein L7F22_036583 [Adiantum nelumboides]|nr:hypothetical protein [Adiantum nelumboides]